MDNGLIPKKDQVCKPTKSLCQENRQMKDPGKARMARVSRSPPGKPCVLEMEFRSGNKVVELYLGG